MKPKTYQLLGVDFGSTSIKVARFCVSQNGELKEEAEAEWIDYTPDVQHKKSGVAYHLLTPEHFDGLLHILHEQLITITPKEPTPENPILVVSGLTNTLALTYKGKTALLLDDPSLRTQPTREEEIIITRTCGIEGLRDASSFMKLLALKKDPAILMKIFGLSTPVGWKDVLFSTALSVVTGFITNTQQRYTIPFDDLRAFGSHTLHANQTIALLDALDILPSKFTVAPSRTIKTQFGFVYQINDFQAEATLISHLFELGLIPQNACVVSMDTVGKIMTKYLTFKKTIADISYETLRNSGRVVKTWIRLLLNPPSHLALYEQMEQILTKNPDDGGYHFYPAVDLDRDGILIAPDGTHIGFDDIHTVLPKHRRSAVVAVVRGVGWEIRHIIQTCLQSNAIKGGVPIVLYGGLTGHHQHGWIDTFAFTLPTTQGLFTLPLTKGALAAAVSALTEIPSAPKASLSFSLTTISKKQSEEKNYASWAEKRPD